jgi:lipopolysaccharide biosynthesis regulator YciM
VAASLKLLLVLYEQEKDWQEAIKAAEKLQALTQQPMHITIAHYYCELAEHEALQPHSSDDDCQQLLKRALNYDKNCVRANLALAKLAIANQHYKTALKQLKHVKESDPDFLVETIPMIRECFHALGDEQGFFNYLWLCLQEHPRISIILALSELIQLRQDDRSAIEFVAEQIRRHPSLRGLNRLIHLYLGNTVGDTKDKLELLNNLVSKLLVEKPVYRCVQCGFAGSNLYWQCPGCHQWSSVRAIQGIEGD